MTGKLEPPTTQKPFNLLGIMGSLRLAPVVANHRGDPNGTRCSRGARNPRVQISGACACVAARNGLWGGPTGLRGIFPKLSLARREV